MPPPLSVASPHGASRRPTAIYDDLFPPTPLNLLTALSSSLPHLPTCNLSLESAYHNMSIQAPHTNILYFLYRAADMSRGGSGHPQFVTIDGNGPIIRTQGEKDFKVASEKYLKYNVLPTDHLERSRMYDNLTRDIPTILTEHMPSHQLKIFTFDGGDDLRKNDMSATVQRTLRAILRAQFDARGDPTNRSTQTSNTFTEATFEAELEAAMKATFKDVA